nr:hypothetical protein [Sphingomonas sp. 2R-10]
MSQPFKRSVLGQYELHGIDDAGFAAAIGRKNRQASLLAEIESLRLEIGPEPGQAQRLEITRISH